jgi:Copper transport outer membrane protein, MctB
MIRSRTYAVPLVAVLLALATGVALGAGPLTDTRSSAAEPHTAGPATPSVPAYPDQFAAAVSSELYAGRLSRRPVALVTMPGADEATVTSLTSQVRAAGGQVTGIYPVGRQLVDGEQKSLVDTLGAELRHEIGVSIPSSATTYPRIGQLMAVALATPGSQARSPNDDVIAVRQSLVAAHLLGVPQGSPTTAPLVLVVMGDAVDQAIADGLLTGLAARARGVVAVAPTADTTLAGLAEDGVTKTVTTVDGAETSAGRVATVLALIRAWSTTGGSYGASGATGAVPLR